MKKVSFNNLPFKKTDEACHNKNKAQIHLLPKLKTITEKSWSGKNFKFCFGFFFVCFVF